MGVAILEVRDLAVEFSTEQGRMRAVDGVSLTIAPGEIVGMVGESGCGKTVTGLAAMGLLPAPSGHIAAGSIRFDGRELTTLPEAGYRRVRGSGMAMIFQDPTTALNPVTTIGGQLVDVLRRRERLTRRQARREAVDLLGSVGIPSPDERIGEYPHELSVGMRQRVVIAMALSCRPKLLFADEPTTALDTTTQAQVLEQIVRMQRDFGTAVVLITHDLGVVAETCERAVVMYCGKIVEQAPIEPLFHAPRHPYTRGLIDSIPRIREQKLERLPTIHGKVPEADELPPGCRFSDRCPHVTGICRANAPPLEGGGARRAACFHPLQDA